MPGFSGAKPEYTGVVDGMSGSPVYIGNRLLGAVSYRIGSFTKEPIAGITPIEQMLEVQKMPGAELTPVDAQTALLDRNPLSDAIHSSVPHDSVSNMDTMIQPLETPLSDERIQPRRNPLLAAADRRNRAPAGRRRGNGSVWIFRRR